MLPKTEAIENIKYTNQVMSNGISRTVRDVDWNENFLNSVRGEVEDFALTMHCFEIKKIF